MPTIFTLTLNPALDVHQFVDQPKLGALNRASKSFYVASGKGVNVSKTLSRLGMTSTAILPLGGMFGTMMQSLLGRGADYISADIVATRSETRCNLKINDEATGTLTEFNDSSPPLKEEDYKACERLLLDRLDKGDSVVLSGSLPPNLKPDVYTKLVEQIQKRGAKTFLDTSGDALDSAVEAKPFLVKPNRSEAEALLAVKLETLKDALDAVHKLFENSQHALLTLGRHGALFATDEGTVFVKPPTVKPYSTNGCGDALLAGYLYGLTEGWALEQRARYAVAVATARALTDGPRFLDQALVPEYEEQVTLVEEADIDLGTPL